MNDPDVPKSRHHRLKRDGQDEQPQFSTVREMLAWEAQQEQIAAFEKERKRIEANAKRSESVSRYQQAKRKAKEAIASMIKQEEQQIKRDIQDE